MVKSASFGKKTGIAVASFGAAMTAMYISPVAVEADIVDLNLPASAPWGASFAFDFVGGSADDFRQFNDSFGKSFTNNGGAGDIAGFVFAPAGNLITTGMAFVFGYGVLSTSSGTATFGFKTDANQVGWLRINFGGFGNAVTYLAAAFNDTPGESIVSGQSAIPEPITGMGALAGLALGAAGVRRRRASK